MSGETRLVRGDLLHVPSLGSVEGRPRLFANARLVNWDKTILFVGHLFHDRATGHLDQGLRQTETNARSAFRIGRRPRPTLHSSSPSPIRVAHRRRASRSLPRAFSLQPFRRLSCSFSFLVTSRRSPMPPQYFYPRLFTFLSVGAVDGYPAGSGRISRRFTRRLRAIRDA